MIKTNIKMRVTPEQSKRVQEICLGNNILWKEGRILATFNDNHYLIIDNKISMYNTLDWFNEISYQEIDADLFIKTNGTCEETYISKYGGTLPKDYNSALKKIENLHIALKKKVEKNKNQALELTKLLEQKKNLQDKLNQANKVVKLGIDNVAELVNFLDKKDEIIKDLETKVNELQSNLNYKNECERQLRYHITFVKSEHNKIIEKLNESRKETTISEDIRYNLEKKLKEKDTIISYLESKLK